MIYRSPNTRFGAYRFFNIYNFRFSLGTCWAVTFLAKVLDAAHALNDAVSADSNAVIAPAGSGQVEGGGGPGCIFCIVPILAYHHHLI